MSIVKVKKALVITLGAGSVLVGQAVTRHQAALCFVRPAESKAPGTPAPELDNTMQVEDVDAAIAFPDVLAIDRMINNLTQLRAAFAEARKQPAKCVECDDGMCGGTGIYEGRKCDGIPF
ncbi:hypothetical protein FHR70_000728 [Microvirga lupini]|uniref:Uncharacterized protein n=1 Tax=Microvirga lupini TaxID=420324 RepID=A0A7W4VI72_9HYPH|nr:hypothetical protein [Microvirga lupini]MBB3017688.1 hypothetical protein [Microvirga lupini]